ncbi:hypothetical protein, partial [Acinetobacter variabilis]|uniref:hypothetical protein n=1 Tax=Acinetobacter variabilis TaxID=70346 RepID=UPI0037705541
MLAYYYLIVFIFTCAVNNLILKKYRIKSFLIFSVFLSFVAIAGFRDPYVVGKDVPNYLISYYEAGIYEWNYFFSENRFELGYLIYIKLL